MLFLKLTVYQSFYVALLAFSYFFLLQGKVLCRMRWQVTSLSRCLFLKRSEDLVEKIISLVIFDTNRLFKR